MVAKRLLSTVSLVSFVVVLVSIVRDLPGEPQVLKVPERLAGGRATLEGGDESDPAPKRRVPYEKPGAVIEKIVNIPLDGCDLL